MKTLHFLLFTFLLFPTLSKSQALVVEAGAGTTLCPGNSYVVGGSPTASGGTPPYTYQWLPNVTITNNTIANPSVTPLVPTWYYCIVTDDSGYTAVDSVLVNLDPIYAYNAGPDTSVCIGDSITLGAAANSFAGGVTYSWVPATGLSNPNAPRPVFSATVTTSYVLTINSPNCPSKVFNVTVTVHPLPVIDASGGTTILEGESTPLSATGGMIYNWTPPTGLSNTSESLTNAEPVQTTTYAVFGVDANGCLNWDTVTVFVIPNNELVFYNTFSPNNDGINDFFYIGNVQKYPQCRLEVYTRTGQEVYSKTGYDNSWDGTNYGDKLPEATYYFTFNPGDGSPVRNGHVTIIR